MTVQQGIMCILCTAEGIPARPKAWGLAGPLHHLFVVHYNMSKQHQYWS